MGVGGQEPVQAPDRSDWYDALADADGTLRVSTQELQTAMAAYDGRADLTRTVDDRFDRMHLTDTLRALADTDATMVELGCGSGTTTRTLADDILDGYDATVLGVDLTDDFAGSDRYVQADATRLPVADDAVDAFVAPQSLGSFISIGVPQRAGRAAMKDTTLYQEAVEAVDDSQVRGERRRDAVQTCAALYVDAYVDQALAEYGRAAADGASLLLADGQLYLHARYGADVDGWVAEEGRGYEKVYGNGNSRERSAAQYYGAWLAAMDDTGYTEQTRTVHR